MPWTTRISYDNYWDVPVVVDGFVVVGDVADLVDCDGGRVIFWVDAKDGGRVILGVGFVIVDGFFVVTVVLAFVVVVVGAFTQ